MNDQPAEQAHITEAQRDAIRDSLLAAMREWSEEEYCAGWLIDLEAKLHAQGGQWETLGRLVGWPIGCDAEDGWETWEDAAARYGSDEWRAARPWLRLSPAAGGQ